MPVFDKWIADGTTSHWAGAGVNYLVQTPNRVLYLIFVDNASDVKFIKSTDGGMSWSAATTVYTGTVTQLSIWYDRWSDIAAGLIHCAWSDSGTDLMYYRSIDTENSDALSTQTTIFTGVSVTTSGCSVSITRARGGNLYCRAIVDAGAEGGFFRSTDVGATWGSRTDIEALATTDQAILLPGWAADNQDIMVFFWDASTNEISRVLYDDSADTWAETSIAVSMTDTLATTAFPCFAAAVDIANSRNLLVAWTIVDTLNADLRCWYVTESAITEVTNVVLNSTDDQGLCAIGIDTVTNEWYVFYAGKSDGSETWTTDLRIYFKVSKDSGTTWGAETLAMPSGDNRPVNSKHWLVTCPRFVGAWFHATADLNNDIYFSGRRISPRAQVMLGV